LSFKGADVGGFVYITTFVSFILAVMMTFPIYFFEARNIMLLVVDICLGKKSLFDDEKYKETISVSKEKMLLTPLRWD
jgi:hypothetical protein